MRSRPRARRALLLALLTAGLLAVTEGPALADTITTDCCPSLQFQDDPGEGGTLTVTASQTSITFTNSTAGDNITAPDATCENEGTTSVTCTPDDIGETQFRVWEARMDDLVDTVVANGVVPGRVFGGDGNDVLTGSNENGGEELLDGDDGDDQINSRDVGPRVPGFGGGIFSAGDGICCFGNIVGDILDGDGGNDVLVSGNGNDSVNGDNCCIFSPDALSGGDGVSPEDVGTDIISTGPGDDSADGRGGDGDQVNLGEGDDQLFEGGTHGTGDVFDGGPGIDSIELYSLTFPASETVWTPDNFSLDLASGAAARTNNGAGSDTALNFEDGFTDVGDDVVAGNDGSNLISTPGGVGGGGIDGVKTAGADGGFTGSPPPSNDIVDGRSGADQVDVGEGNDLVEARDGFQDRVQCGPGADTVNADQFDVLSLCEAVTIEERRAAGADIAAPDCTVTKVKKSYSRTAFFRGFRVTVACNEGATLLIQLLATLKKGLFSKTGDVVLAEKTVTLTGANTTVKIKPPKRFKRRVRKKGFRARVKVEARDQYGNRSLEQKKLKVKKPKRKRKRR